MSPQLRYCKHGRHCGGVEVQEMAERQGLELGAWVAGDINHGGEKVSL